MAYTYTNIQRIFAKIQRDFGNAVFDETEIVEYVGEALKFMNTPNLLIEKIVELDVRHYTTILPDDLVNIIQLAKDTQYHFPNNEELNLDADTIFKTAEGDLTFSSDKDRLEYVKNNSPKRQEVGEGQNHTIANIRPYSTSASLLNLMDKNAEYQKRFVALRLTNNTMFSYFVQNTEPSHYLTEGYSYKIQGGMYKKAIFSFENGGILLAYLGQDVDDKGYPIIPDEQNCISALTYYVKWKMAERMQWNLRQGSQNQVEYNYTMWKKYLRQAINESQMPKTLDEYKNLMEQENQILTPRNSHGQFYENIGKSGY